MVSLSMYDDRFVCFIDILGFKELITASALPIEPDKLLPLGDDRPRSAKGILGILNNLRFCLELHKDAHYDPESDRYKELIKYTQPVFKKGDIPDFQFNFFSDSIVFSVNRLNLETIKLFCNLVERITSLLFECSSACRGGIAFGKLYHKDNIVFGPAMIEAYKIEQEAIYPRIIISKDIIASLSKNELSRLKKIWITQDDDQQFFIDIIKSYASCDKYNETVTSFTHCMHWLLSLHLKHKCLKTCDKYNWYRVRFNALLKRVKKFVKTECPDKAYREEFLNLPYFK